MKGKLRKQLRGAPNYKEWREAAEVMDEYLQFDAWKAVSLSCILNISPKPYDYPLR